MKKAFLILIFILSSSYYEFSIGQISHDQAQNIEDSFLAYFSTLNDKNNLTLDCYYRKVFDFMKRADFLSQMDNIDSMKVKMKYANCHINEIGSTISLKGIDYSTINFTYTHLITETKETVESAFYNVDLALQIFRDKHGEKNVSWDPETYTYNITITSFIYAIKDNASKAWSFVPNDLSENIINELIPKKIRKTTKPNKG